MANHLIANGSKVNFTEVSTLNEWCAPVLHDAIIANIGCIFWHHDDQSLVDEFHQTLEKMLQLGADANARDTFEIDAVTRLAMNAHQDLVDHPEFKGVMLKQIERLFKLLLKHGADLSTVRKYKKVHESTLDVVRRYQFEHFCNIKDAHGVKALKQALSISASAYEERNKVIQQLLKAGAKPARKDGSGESAIDVARKQEDLDLIQMLERSAGIKSSTSRWSMVGGANCLLCEALKQWQPSKHHPTYFVPADIEDVLGTKLPHKVRSHHTHYRNKIYVPLHFLKSWHAELCQYAKD